MQQTVVQLRDIQEIYGDKWEGLEHIGYQADAKRSKINATFMEEDIPIRIINELGPYSAVYIEGSSAWKFIIPTNKIQKKEVVPLIDRLKPVLDNYYPNRWTFHTHEPDRLHIYYPELTITNNMGMSHTIYDLVIFFKINKESGHLNYLYGKRYSFSKSELLSGYSHSHLKALNNNTRNNYTDFCRGGQSKFDIAFKALNKRNSVKELELFFLQLDQYLAWESLEGKPHISMTKIGSGRNGDGSSTLLGGKLEIELAIFLLERVVQRASQILVNTGISYMIDYSIDPEWFYLNIEREIIANFDNAQLNLIDWDERAMVYIDIFSVEIDRLPPTDDYDEVIVQAFNITPRVIHEDKPIEQKIVKRLSTSVIYQIVDKANTLLINGTVTPTINE